MRFSLLSLVMLLLANAAMADTYTIDFESIGVVGSQEASFDTQGFTFTQSSYGIGVVDSISSTEGSTQGNAYFFCMDCENPTGFSMSRTDDTLFSMLAFDAGFYQLDPMPLTVTGTYANNSQISASFNNITGFYDTLTMGTGWNGLKSVSFAVDTTNNYPFNVPTFDNIVVSAVPVPAAVWLFGSALGILGWARKRTTS